MKTWTCPECNRQRDSKDEVVMKICKVCMVEMEINEVENGTS